MAMVSEIAAEVLELLGSGRQVAPFSERHAGFGIAEAYQVVALTRAARQARGERPAGRKIGFTNRTIWARYNVSGPIWHHVYDTTVAPLGEGISLAGTAEPRIEPEIVFRLGGAPRPGMSTAEVFGCVEAVAHGFEIVDSPFAGWRFAAADGIAAHGLHAGLRFGDWDEVGADRAGWLEALGGFTVELSAEDGTAASGRSADVLGSPAEALRFLVEEIAAYPGNPALEAGEIVTTGTLTDALPVRPGQVWRSRLDGIGLGEISLELR